MSKHTRASKGFLRMGSTKGIKDEDFMLMVFFMLFVVLVGFYIVIGSPKVAVRRIMHQAYSTMHGAAPAGGASAAVVEKVVCEDGIDNDGDGKIDYPADEGCDSLSDSTEGFACNDGIDNDNDGQVDSTDSQCSSDADDSESVVDTCRDGVDNDKDGRIDYPSDDGCDSVTDPRED